MNALLCVRSIVIFGAESQEINLSVYIHPRIVDCNSRKVRLRRSVIHQRSRLALIVVVISEVQVVINVGRVMGKDRGRTVDGP